MGLALLEMFFQEGKASLSLAAHNDTVHDGQGHMGRVYQQRGSGLSVGHI